MVVPLVADPQAGSGRPVVSSDPITRWLLMVAILVIGLVTVGGFVRLSRAGLSIVEWDAVTGIVPPIGDAAWQRSFADYQQTPEYQIVNSGMDLADYQHIFYIEWAHRLIARVAGLLVVLPLLWFLRKGLLSPRDSLRYWMVAALFGVQGVIGWAMVSSGLRDRPSVSHFRLTIHLLTALALLSIVLWMALNRIAASRPAAPHEPSRRSSASRILSPVLLAVVVVQIGYGGLVAGLRAGYVSNTWPLMFGQLVPLDVLTARHPWWANLSEAVGSHWIHRWMAFVVAGIAVALFVAIRRELSDSRVLKAAAGSLLAAVSLQISLGICVVLLGVPKWLALAHQGVGVTLFCISLVITHQVRWNSRSSSAAGVPVNGPSSLAEAVTYPGPAS